MPLLQEQSQPDLQQSQLPVEQESNQSDINNSNGLSFDSMQIEKSMKEQLPKEKVSQLDKILTAGNKLLFGKDTHYQIIDGMQGLDGEQLSAAIGNGALALTSVLAEKSGNTLPGDLIGPAVTILMTRAAEFINESGMANVTDDIIEEAMHIFSVKVMDQADPEFRNKLGMNQDQQMNPTETSGELGGPPAGLLNASQGGV